MSKKKSSSQQSGLVTGYLFLYNIGNAATWGYVLYNTIISLISTNFDVTATYKNASIDLPWIQSIAVLEIFHALFGLVRSPVGTTVMQVFSRLLLAVGILYFFPVYQAIHHWALTTMTLAWSITEVIRYLFYAFSLIGSVPSLIQWCRYSFFFILYPVGASSEVIVAYQALPVIKQASLSLYYGLIVILLSYPLGFFQLFTYMIKQRSKYLAEKKKKSS